MPAPYVVNAAAHVLLALVTLAGLLARRRLSASYVFALLLLSHATNHALDLVSAERWWTWRKVLVTDWIQAALVILIAFEVASRVFRNLPPALKVASHVFRGILLLLLIWLLVSSPSVWKEDLVEQMRALRGLIGRVFYGSSILFVAFLTMVRYYGIPLDPVHRDIATGLGVLGGLVAMADMHLGKQGFFVAMSILVFVFWAWSAWKPEEATALSPVALRFLQPWRAKRLSR